MTSEELKIRGELEKDIERELEEEIKDGICRLALRLHRLYQRQMGRKARELPKYGVKSDQEDRKKNTFTEVDINIKMEGGTRIEIKEIKKNVQENRVKSSPKTELVKKGTVVAPKCKKFDWVKSLRSGPNSLSDDNKIAGSCHCKLHGNQGKTGKNASQPPGVDKADKIMLLEQGWKE